MCHFYMVCPLGGRIRTAQPRLVLTRPAVSVRINTLLYGVCLLALILVGFGLRLILLQRFPFREDEATYSYWALVFWRQDPLFLHVWPDKPPLFLWLLAGAFRLFGVSEVSARWLNIAISTLTVPLTAAIARRAWGISAGLTAAVVLTLNPFAISFAPTAFTDPLLVLAGMLALCLALRDRAFWAGVWLGAAIMTKQQGLLYIPLAVGGLLLGAGKRGNDSRRDDLETGHRALRRWGGFILGAGMVILPIIYWDSLRWAIAPSPWARSLHTYAALTFVAPDQWWTRGQRLG